MKIKRVEILGFKSFVDRVVLDFPEGITTVVGPNGCGKSNVVDSIRWAMGEQSARNLRGRSMEDVIFGGSESRRPLGMAEVSLIFSNEDGIAPPAFREFSEIMVTRRLYRNGESEYLINQVPCRLLDVAELFMDTGVGIRAYSIIEQGKIGMILNAKPEERRFLIEEAAGVTKYKSRKKAALRKIEATRQNLQRLGDIVAEVRRQLNSLKRQAQKAERFRALREELKGIEIRLAGERYRQLRAEREDLENRQEQSLRAVEAAERDLAAGELQAEESRLRQIDQEKSMAHCQEGVFHLTAELQKVESRVELNGKELEHLLRQREHLAAEAAGIGRRLEELGGEEESLRLAQAGLGSNLESEMRRLGEGEACLEELTAEEKALAARQEQARQNLFAVLTELSRIGSGLEEAERRSRSLEERTRRNRSEAVALRQQGGDLQQRIAAVETALRELRNEQAGLVLNREELQERILVLRRQQEENEQALLQEREGFNVRRSRLDTLLQLEKDLDGYGQGVRLLQTQGFMPRLGPMVADILEVPPRLEAAVEAVLGDRLQALVGTGSEAVLEALGFLNQSEGRCTFILPAEQRDSRTDAAPPGARPLRDEIAVRAGFADATAALLSGIFLVDRLEPYLARGLPPGVTLVTEAGETLGFRSDLTGGGRELLKRGVLQKKREIKELTLALEGLGAALKELEAVRLQLRDELAAAEKDMEDFGTAGHRLALKVVDGEKDLLRLRQESERLEERLEVLSLEETQLHEEQNEVGRLLAQAGDRRQELEQRKGTQEQALADLQEEVRTRRQDVDLIRERVTALKVAVAGIREREESGRRQLDRLGRLRDELHRQEDHLQKRQTEGGDQAQRLREEAERLRTELEVLFARREEARRAYEQAREVYEANAVQTAARVETLKEMRGRTLRAREDLTAIQLQGRDLELESELQRQTILDRYRIDLIEQDDAAPDLDETERGRARRRREELEQLMAEFGEVNLMAVDEFRELEERFLFLTRQQDDLKTSLDGLQTAIAKINRTTRKRFRETFDLVNDKFQEVFPRLFRGGRAELRLTDENDLLETGIEIVAQPPGKKLQGVSLLSGGEKALTAVALIFSIFLVKPSPFCLLDEVDAPLDDANIGRFNEMVKDMAGHSQFIIITHNKRTMEMADTLYGITMEEPGVSKLVSVRLNG